MTTQNSVTSAFVSKGISSLDNILGGGLTKERLRYFVSNGTVQKAISVFKKRGSAHENTLRKFDITSRGIEVGTVLNKFQGILTGVPTSIDSE